MNIQIKITFVSLCLLACSAQFVDEMQQIEQECLGEDKFPCMGGGCILQSQYCDGIANCEDGTDESFCVDHPPDEELCNETHHHMCSDKKKCIPNQWICNNETDCDDGSDELNCTSTFVAENATCAGFRCGDGTCISTLWVCDGTYDCKDKSDESTEDLCRHSLLQHLIRDGSFCQEFPAIGDRNYKCLDSSYCLPNSMMCDGMKDCRDGSDEGPFCKKWSTMCKSFQCNANDTVCSPERYGPVCLCLPPATRQYNYIAHRCEDVDECRMERPQCSHRCINGHGHFRCDCDEGYSKDEYGYLCFAKGPEAMLFFTTRNEIKFLKVKSKQLVTVATGIKQAHGVAYDGKYLYWVEAAQGHQAIVRAQLEDIDGTKEVLVGLGLEDPGDISIDWLGGNLYFGDAGRGSIFACRLDGTICSAVTTHAKHPKYLTVDPTSGKMYWADWLNRAVIMSAKMDGTEPEVLVEGLSMFASGLALDAPNGRLYYVDRTIRVVMLEEKNVYSLFEEPFHHPYAVSVFENTVLWSDWTSMTIQSTDKLHGTHQKRNVLLTLKTPVFGMHIYHPALMRSGRNPCAHHNCSHLCFVTSNATSACACPHGMELKGNMCTHVVGYRAQYLIVAGAQLFTRIEYNSLGNPETHASHFDIGRVQAMAYDSLRDTLYLYDGQRRTINNINMSEFALGLTHLFLHQGLDNVVDMDYDYATDTLYYLDAGRRLIGAVSLRTHQRAIVYKFLGEEIPISFCVITNYGRMLVAVVESEQHNDIHIDSIGLDGEGRHNVVMNNLKGPHVRLKYAQFMDTVFVSDEGNGVIDYMHPEGTGRENYRELSTTVTSLAVTETYVFWTDRRTPRLFWSEVHESTHRIRRIQLSLFPNSTQLLIQAASPRPLGSGPLSHPCLLSPCSDVCVQSPASPGYKCLCPPGLMLQHGRCTELVECKEYELYCHRSNACIEKRKYCDGVIDCTFGEDETGCKVLPSYLEEVCSDTQFQCRNSTICIERSLFCDSHADCPDGSDEVHSECDTLACFDTEFMCTSGSCILKTWKCDGDSDCNDATDEIGCENAGCKSGYYQCRNKECVELKRRCDGQQDCFDFSDEEECDEPVIVDIKEELLPRCAVDEYACELNKSICLPPTARCNMKVECPGGTDENGCEFRCGPRGLFACKQQLQCIQMHHVCDAHQHCADGSDETPDACAIANRTSRVYPPAAPVLYPASECRDGLLCSDGQCVAWRDVCDGRPHCPRADDEGGHCSTACEGISCSHACQPSPAGARCVCPDGYHHAGPHICEDIDECQLGVCSHACLNTPGSYVCSCHRGYALRSDRRSCKATRGIMSILYVSANTVRSVSADGHGVVEFSDPDVATLTDLDYDVRKNKLYVTSAESSKLIEVNGTHGVLSVTNVGRPTRVAVDWITGNVYFVDSTPGDSCIRVCDIKKKRCARLQKLPSDAKVSSLIVDPMSRLMFYCVGRALESVVWAAPLSGRSARDLATVSNCTGLAADSFKRALYVAEARPPHIVRMDYDGDGHNKIVGELRVQLEAARTLALFEDHMYYLVADSFRISRCLLHGLTHCETYIHRVFDANTFVIRHESVQRDDVTNDCESVACANVCVLDVHGAACVCDDGSLAREGVCPLVKKENLPLFNGWSYQDYLRAHHASLTVVIVALVLLVLYLGLFVYYHFVYKPRKSRSDAYTEVRYQTNAPGGPSLSYAPTVDMAADGSVSHEFVNPLQYARTMWRQSFRGPKAVGTAGLNIDVIPSPSHSQDYSDTEADFDDKESLIITRK